MINQIKYSRGKGMDEFLVTFADDKSQLLDYFEYGTVCRSFSITHLDGGGSTITHVSGCSIHIRMEDVNMFKDKLS